MSRLRGMFQIADRLFAGMRVIGKAREEKPFAEGSNMGSLMRLLRPQAAYRWILPQLSAITPQYIEAVLRGALAGNHVQQWELFDLMFDTWPELAACSTELTDGVMGRKPIFEAFAEEDEEATDEALDRCKLVSTALRGMRPDAYADENDFAGTLRDILDGWFRGVTCLEIDWATTSTRAHGEFFAPRATNWVHPVCFGFGSDGRLGLRVDASGSVDVRNFAGMSLEGQSAALSPLPAHKFLVGIHKSKSGTALGGSLLRPLAWWWCAANFSADWLLNLAQVFGLPFRWANYEAHAPQATVDAVCNMLQNMGSAGWAAFPAGTTLELKESTKQGGDHSPQGELLDRADRYARLVILGQTMSGSQDASKGGGKAFGAVESDVKTRRMDAAAKYVEGVINSQLIPSILMLNYGDTAEAPTVKLMNDEEAGLDEAQRDRVLAEAGLKIPASYLRKKYGLPELVEGEDVIGGSPADNAPDLEFEDPDSEDWDEEEDDDDIFARELIRILSIQDDAIFARDLAVIAGDFHGHPFRGNQYTKHLTTDKSEKMNRGAGVILTGEEFGKNLGIGELRKAARKHMEGIRGNFITNETTNTPILIDRKGSKEVVSKFRLIEELQAVAGIESMIKRADYVGNSFDEDGRSDIKMWHEYEVPVQIGTKKHHFTIKVRELKDGHRFYDSYTKKIEPAAKSGTASKTLGDPKANTGSSENMFSNKEEVK